MGDKNSGRFDKERRKGDKNKCDERNKEYEGVVVAPRYGSRKKQIKCEVFLYPLDIAVENVDEFYEDEVVIFKVGKKPFEKNGTKNRLYAYDIRLKDGE